jgi:hypothetical protein
LVSDGLADPSVLRSGLMRGAGMICALQNCKTVLHILWYWNCAQVGPTGKLLKKIDFSAAHHFGG